MLSFNQELSILIVVLVVALGIVLVIIFIYGTDGNSLIIWPSPNPFSVPPHSTVTPHNTSGTLPEPNFQLVQTLDIKVDVGPSIAWNAEGTKGLTISVVGNVMVAAVFLSLDMSGYITQDPLQPPIEFETATTLYNGTCVRLYDIAESNTTIGLISGLESTTTHGIVHMFIFKNSTWTSFGSPLRRYPQSEDGDEFGKNIGLVTNLLTEISFFCFSTSIGIANQFGAVQLFKYTTPNTLVFDISLEIGDTTGMSSISGYGNSLATANGSVVVGCPGFTDSKGNTGIVYHFVLDLESSTWGLADSILSTAAINLGSSLAMNKTATRLLVGAIGGTEMFYYGINGGDTSGIVSWELKSPIAAPLAIAPSSGNLKFGSAITALDDLRYIVVYNNTLVNEQYVWIYRLNTETDLFETNNASTTMGAIGDPQAVNLATQALPSTTINYLVSPSSIILDKNNLAKLIGVSSLTSKIVVYQNNL